VVGWEVGASLLALVGMLGAIAALMLWVWQRECLTGVSYRRTLGQRRATFGEEVSLEVELVNDKLLPLTWLHVEDEMPKALEIKGSAVPVDRSVHGQLHHLLPMLPFQRVRRRFTVICDQRGEHTFGPAHLRSGDPIGLHEKFGQARERDELLVYPKLFRLDELPVASRVPLGDERSRVNLIGDPSRIAGVREYRAGDPLRHIDWRASARGGSLLVREFEPTTTLRVAVFVDMRPPSVASMEASTDILELTIALGASVVADLAGRGVATGLYASGAVDDQPVAREPSTSPAALPAMLELLAKATRRGPLSMVDLLTREGRRLGHGASVVIVAASFPESTLVALEDLRRRMPITALWVATDDGQPPPPEMMDGRGEVRYDSDWRTWEVVDIRP
jgi:uncharacterized protein (DUF58 family)